MAKRCSNVRAQGSAYSTLGMPAANTLAPETPGDGVHGRLKRLGPVAAEPIAREAGFALALARKGYGLPKRLDQGRDVRVAAEDVLGILRQRLLAAEPVGDDHGAARGKVERRIARVRRV